MSNKLVPLAHDESSPIRSGGTGSVTQDDLARALLALRRSWWIILAGGVLAVVAARLAMLGDVPVYTSEVLLRRTETSPLSAAGLAGMSGEYADDFGSQLEMIRSRTVLSPVVDTVGLAMRFDDYPEEQSRIVAAVEVDRTAEGGSYALAFYDDQVRLLDEDAIEEISAAPPGGWLSGPGFRLRVDDARRLGGEPVAFSIRPPDRVVESLRRSLQVEPGKGLDLIRVFYTDPDPIRSAKVVNSVAESYTAFRARSASEAATIRRRFLAEQMVELSDSLRQAQNLLMQYQETERLLDPSGAQGELGTSLLGAEDELRTLRFQERLLESLAVTARSDDGSLAALQRIIAMGREVLPGGDALYQRLQEQEIERSRLTASRFGLTDASPEVQVVDSLIASTRSQVRVAAEESLALLRERRMAMEQRVGELRGQVGSMPERAAGFVRLQQRVDAIQSAYNPLVANYYDAQLAEAVQVGDISVVDPALIPVRPDATNAGLELGIAFIVGLMLSMGAVGARYYFDPTVQSRGDVEESAGLPVFSVIPNLKSVAGPNGIDWAGVESFRSLAANLRFLRPGGVATIAVASAVPAEGKTTIAANLAITLAQMGTRVLLVDADMRMPAAHKVFRLEKSPGLSEVLLGEADLEAAIQAVPQFGLDLLPAGRSVENPTMLLANDVFTQLHASLRRQYEVVIVDTAPVLMVSDCTLVAAEVDGVIMAVRAARSNRVAVAQAVAQLRQAKARLWGVVLNDAPKDGLQGRLYYGEYLASGVYGSPEDERVAAGAAGNRG